MKMPLVMLNRQVTITGLSEAVAEMPYVAQKLSSEYLIPVNNSYISKASKI